MHVYLRRLEPQHGLHTQHTYACTYGNIMLSFRFYEMKTKRPFPLYETPSPFRWNICTIHDLKAIRRWINNQRRLGRSRVCNYTAVASWLSLICRSTSTFTVAVIFVGRPKLGLLSMLFIPLCFCGNLCIPIWLPIKPSSRNMRQIVGGL